MTEPSELVEPDEIVWLRDLDGTGSMHVCTPHCPGAVRYIREDLSAMTDPLAMAKAQLSDDGPQPFIVAPRLTCTGCRHLKTEWWKDYLDNDETDSGTSARCGALPDEYGGKSITAYWTDNRSPPSWCPRAIDPATLEVNRATD